MNKQQAQHFAIGSTVIAALVFLGLTLDSHRQFHKLTHAQDITPAVKRGKDVWHKNNCINCHTLFGEGAYYAPDLTKIAQQRGAPYLKAYLHDPSKFYDESRHRRLMPKQDITDAEIGDLVAFLDWISKVDNNGWPPRPITVVGTSFGVASTQPNEQLTPDKDPVALGAALFKSASPSCATCHSLAAGVNMAGPSLAGIATRASQTIASPDYKGKAKDAQGYLHESITQPSAHIVAGGMYSANGVSFMPNTFGHDLTSDQIAQLVAYLATFK